MSANPFRFGLLSCVALVVTIHVTACNDDAATLDRRVEPPEEGEVDSGKFEVTSDPQLEEVKEEKKVKVEEKVKVEAEVEEKEQEEENEQGSTEEVEETIEEIEEIEDIEQAEETEETQETEETEETEDDSQQVDEAVDQLAVELDDVNGVDVREARKAIKAERKKLRAKIKSLRAELVTIRKAFKAAKKSKKKGAMKALRETWKELAPVRTEIKDLKSQLKGLKKEMLTSLQLTEVYCSSDDGDYAECPVDGQISAFAVSRKYTKKACFKGRTFGTVGAALWVDKGCRAKFLIRLE